MAGTNEREGSSKLQKTEKSPNNLYQEDFQFADVA
ncbi:hypothetical protein CCACVL1_06607 [Corchorus capsularis]|uniref:Uncharacterized protein n=1 Tax=Corchorus capsularis TaxID=210143 RepID=A0A1R3JE97_COCAP|nr:hypothetical protein CCACVL1_06607 [Corchorus capsularis]